MTHAMAGWSKAIKHFYMRDRNLLRSSALQSVGYPTTTRGFDSTYYEGSISLRRVPVNFAVSLGSVNRNVEPTPGLLSAVNSPPCASM